MARIEATRPGLDIRFVVTNVEHGAPEWIYDTFYCARGQAENLIKLHKTQLASDRTSCRSPIANQVRLVLHTAACWLMLSRLRFNAERSACTPAHRRAPERDPPDGSFATSRFQDVPNALELATNANGRASLELLFAPLASGRPVLGPPDIPADRAAALQKGFDATMDDP